MKPQTKRIIRQKKIKNHIFLMREKEDEREGDPDLKHDLLTLLSMDFRFVKEGQKINHENLNQPECLFPISFMSMIQIEPHEELPEAPEISENMLSFNYFNHDKKVANYERV